MAPECRKTTLGLVQSLTFRNVRLFKHLWGLDIVGSNFRLMELVRLTAEFYHHSERRTEEELIVFLSSDMRVQVSSLKW